MMELRWERKVSATGGGKYPLILLPAEFREWIGRKVLLTYKDGQITITLVEEENQE